MDSVKLQVILFGTYCALSMCMALDCNWKTQYEYEQKCCQICPPGEFPVQNCKDSNQSQCKKCTGRSDHCFCNGSSCEDDRCSTCSPSAQCKNGEGLMRTGLFKFQYICIKSQKSKGEEDKTDKPSLVNPDLPVLPSNTTRTATCHCQVYSGMVMCLVIASFFCLAMLIYLCIQRTREQRTKKKYPLSSSSLKEPSDECVCKLSKEEMGV